jgi:hypothetical protein
VHLLVWIINNCLSFLTPVTHKALFRYSAQIVCIHFRHCEHRRQSSTLLFSVNKPAHYRHSASTSFSFSFPQLSSSSDPEETPNLLYGEIGGFFISLLPVFTTGLIGLLFSPERHPLSLISFCCTLCFSQTDSRHVCFLSASVECPPVFFSNSAVCRQMVMIYAEPGPEDLASLVPCFKIEGNG